MIYKCTYCTIPLARGISRSDTVENVVKTPKEIAEKRHQRNSFNCKHWRLRKGEFGNKNTNISLFLDLVKELNKVEGIEELEFLLSNRIY